MQRSRKLVATSLLFGLLVASVLWLTPLRSVSAVPVALPYSAYAAGPYQVRGSTILDARNQPYYFHGVARDGLEFSCLGDNYLTPQYLALLGPQVQGLGGTFWYGNTVRLPLSEAFWLHGQPQQHCAASTYQVLVRNTIGILTLLHLNVIVDLQWTDAGGQSTGGSWQMADTDSITFWQQMAKLYAHSPNVLFELYNEPHPYASTGDPWACWRSGCRVINDTSNDFYCGCHLTLSYQAVGMQTLVDTIRQAGASNLLLIGGLNWGFDLSQIGTYALTGTNLVYDTHPYPYNGKLTASDWQASFGGLSSNYALISTESGEYDCKATFMQQLIPYFDVHHISWIGWAWYAKGSPCSFPELVSDYYGTPEPALGTYIYRTLLNYAGVAPRASFTLLKPGVGPVGKQWYFPGEPVGDGFSQAFIVDDASLQDCAVNIRYVLQSAQGTPVIKTVALKIVALGRVTSTVNRDLGILVTAAHVLVAAMVVVDGGATPNCPGVVVERVVHLTDRGFTGGSALPGLTTPSNAFFFAQLPTSKDNSRTSALAVFNPGSTQASVDVRYFAAGRQEGIQHVVLSALAARQVTPPANLPAQASVELTSNQPIVAARSTLLKNVNARNARSISGFTEVPGVIRPASDWLFAEGYTGSGFQENLVIANPAGSGAHLTITLQYANGTTGVFRADVSAHSQLAWDVNANAASAANSTPDVAVEIASDAPVVAERVIYFRYSVGRGTITGITDLPGLARSAVASLYTFSDGYSGSGFDEWLSLQNATSKRELITITLVHGGQLFKYQVYLSAHTRGTISIGRLLRLLGQSAADYDVSLVVQSDGGAFVAERPLYWNMAESQGGSDVFGYPGS